MAKGTVLLMNDSTLACTLGIFAVHNTSLNVFDPFFGIRKISINDIAIIGECCPDDCDACDMMHLYYCD